MYVCVCVDGWIMKFVGDITVLKFKPYPIQTLCYEFILQLSLFKYLRVLFGYLNIESYKIKKIYVWKTNYIYFET